MRSCNWDYLIAFLKCTLAAADLTILPVVPSNYWFPILMCGSHAQTCDSYTVYAVDHVTVHAQDTMQKHCHMICTVDHVHVLCDCVQTQFIFLAQYETDNHYRVQNHQIIL